MFDTNHTDAALGISLRSTGWMLGTSMCKSLKIRGSYRMIKQRFHWIRLFLFSSIILFFVVLLLYSSSFCVPVSQWFGMMVSVSYIEENIVPFTDIFRHFTVHFIACFSPTERIWQCPLPKNIDRHTQTHTQTNNQSINSLRRLPIHLMNEENHKLSLFII